MQKRILLTFVLVLSIISLVSAYSYNYNSFSLGSLLDEIDASTMILGALFIMFFAFTNFALSKYFKGNKAAAGVVSFVFSLLLIWGINRTGFDYENFFYDIGISPDLLSTLVPIILLIGAVILIWKFGIGMTLITFGLLFIGVSFTELIYEDGVAALIGVILLVAGLYFYNRKKKLSPLSGYDSNVPQGQGRFQRAGRWMRNNQQRNYQAAQERDNRYYQQRAEKAAYKEEARRKQQVQDRAQKAAYEEEARRRQQVQDRAQDKAIAEDKKREMEAARKRGIEEQNKRVKLAKEQQKVIDERLAKKQAEMKAQMDRKRGIEE